MNSNLKTSSSNEEYEKILTLLRDCKSRGITEFTVRVSPEFSAIDFICYVHKIDTKLLYAANPSMNEKNTIICKLYMTETAFLDRLCTKLAEKYASKDVSSSGNKYCPVIYDYLKPYDIKEWYEYITSRINIVDDMWIDRNGILIIKLLDSRSELEKKARSEEVQQIAFTQHQAFERRINRIMDKAIEDGRDCVTFTNFDTNYDKSIVVPDYVTMDLINSVSIVHYTPEEVFTFAMKLCTNDIDREFERFEDDELDKIASIFVGKCASINHGVIDNDICIYHAEVVIDPSKKTKDNRPYKYVKALAFIPKINLNEEKIRNINKGIRGGISISVSCNDKICSICGKADCKEHVPGSIYDGKICYTRLSDVMDAYEFSFTDCPAQDAMVLPNDFENSIIEYDSEFDKIMRTIYRNYMDHVAGFSYIADPKSLVVNLKQRDDEED